VNEFALVLVFVFLGNALGLFEGFVVHLLLGNGEDLLNVLYAWYLPALVSNNYLLILLLPPALIGMRYLKMNIETRSMFFVILFSMVIVSLLSFLLIGLENRDLSRSVELSEMPGREAFIESRIIRNFRWLGVFLLGIVVAGSAIGYYFSKKYLQPIYDLTQASDKLKNGSWTEKDNIRIGKGSSEMESLIGLFNNMANEVYQREKKLGMMIRELQLRADKTKEDQMFREITETDFFRELEKKSKLMRDKRTKGLQHGKEQGYKRTE